MLLDKIIVSNIRKHGFGFGNDEKAGFDELAGKVGADFVTAAQNVIVSGHVIVPISTTDQGQAVADDGCGDGREVSLVSQSGKTLKTSLHRSKVFGGGVMMTVASRIGLGAGVRDDLISLFDEAIEQLDKHKVDYGAHTDTHANGDQSGCGAIDNAPTILSNIKKFHENISQTLIDLNLGFRPADIESVLKHFESFVSKVDNGGYKSKTVVEAIADRGKVIKRLNGLHKELFVLLNMIPGTTADQSLIRAVTGGKAQLFDVDVWRLQTINDKLYEREPDRHIALLAQLVYTLGTAATLTKGDLPVYLAQTQTD